jgi:hypothetical protein
MLSLSLSYSLSLYLSLSLSHLAITLPTSLNHTLIPHVGGLFLSPEQKKKEELCRSFEDAPLDYEACSGGSGHCES